MAAIASCPSIASPKQSPSFSPKNANFISTRHSRKQFPTIKNPTFSSLRNPTPPAIQSLKSRLAAGETLYGLFLLSCSPTLAEIAGFAGYDYVVIDMEHGPGGIPEALSCLRALASSGTAAILRLPETSPTWAKKALDLGPQGLMFPMIENASAAEHAVSCCRFPPRGVRGSAHTVVRASAYGTDESYLISCEEDLLIMCQIETAAAAENVGEIAGVDGVDCLQMGPMDLSASMGCLLDSGNGEVGEMLRAVERRVFDFRKVGGKMGGTPYLSGFAMPFDPPADLKIRGYDMVAGAVDVGMFGKAAVEDVRSFRLVEKENR